MTDWLLERAWWLLTPLVVAPLTYLAMQGVKSASAAFDRLPATAKRGAAAFIAAVLTGVFAATGVVAPCIANAAEGCGLHDLDLATVEQLVQWGLGTVGAYLMHARRKARRRR